MSEYNATKKAMEIMNIGYDLSNSEWRGKIKDKMKFLDKNIELQWASTSYNEIDVEKYQYALEILENLLKEN